MNDVVIESVARAIAIDGLSFSGDKNGLKIILARLEGHCGDVPQKIKQDYMKASLRLLDAQHSWETAKIVSESGPEEDEWDRQHRENQVYDMLVEVYFWQKKLDALS